MRIEQLLDLGKDVVERSKLPPHEPGSAQSVAVFATDRTADIQHLFVEIGRHILHLLDALGRCQIEEGTNVQLAVCGVSEQGRRHLMRLQAHSASGPGIPATPLEVRRCLRRRAADDSTLSGRTGQEPRGAPDARKAQPLPLPTPDASQMPVVYDAGSAPPGSAVAVAPRPGSPPCTSTSNMASASRGINRS